MKPRLNANSWVLIVLLGILVVIGIDVGRNYLYPPGAAEAKAQAAKAAAPTFKKGDRPPDFTLPDAKGKKHTLSTTVKRDTLLFFICGCASCRSVQNYVGQLQRKLGDRCPDIISVSTTDPDAEKAYRRDTKLDHLILYEPPRGPIMEQYRGNPCPRAYGVSAEGRLTFIGHSPAEAPALPLLAYELAEHLGFQSPQGAKAEPGKETAPIMKPEQVQPTAAAADGGHGPGDGHGHGPGDGHGH